jgi:hypothetical protein
VHKGRGGSDSQHFVQLLRKSMAKAAPARTSAGRKASAAAAPVASSSTSTEAHARLKRRGCCWCVLLGGRELGPRRGVGAAGRGIRTRSGRAGSCGRERGGPVRERQRDCKDDEQELKRTPGRLSSERAAMGTSARTWRGGVCGGLAGSRSLPSGWAAAAAWRLAARSLSPAPACALARGLACARARCTVVEKFAPV